ncbi:MAG: NYN domain-containing protein [Leptolyngbyaceae cyanobacterium bins.59]|nr:NYN domain-containing protein [Leptolyngbyaceae cyanobacterium bins.59]
MANSRPKAILLVDGYNIVGAWSVLKQTCDREGMEPARRQLTEALVNYSAYQGYDTRIVFDAQYQDTPGSSEVVTQHVSIHYTDFGQTADTFIEKFCALFRNDARKFEQRLIVATSDRAQQLTVVGYGAECLSAQRLSLDMDLAIQKVHRAKSPAKRSRNRFLGNTLDPSAQQLLTKLRFGVENDRPSNQKNL